jgi:IS30 family transposase
MPKGCQLTDIDRQIIELGVRKKKGIREIAAIIVRSHSVVSREIRRNSGASGYQQKIATRIAGERARKTNKRKLNKNLVLQEYVRKQIRLGLSPEQIAGQLNALPPKKLHGASVSHEAIYAWIYDSTGRDCIPYLRKRHRKRRVKGARRKQRFTLQNRVSIHVRPKRIDARTGVGDWEDDTVICSGGKEVLAVQYHRTLMLARISKVPDKSATSHEWALRAKMEKDPSWLWRSITRDNGTENALHEETRKYYKVKSYFCDTYSSWQKGGVENLNGLIRQYFPKSLDLGTIPHEAVQLVEDLLNNRPRKKLNYSTPNQALNRLLLKRSQSGAINP